MQPILAIIFSMLIFSSCKQNSDNNLHVYNIAEEGLQQSTVTISKSTDLIFLELKEKTFEYATKEKAMFWQPIAMEIKRLSDGMVNYIVSLKKEFKDESGGNDLANKDWQNNSKVTEHVLKSHGKGSQLLRKLVQYKNDILVVDPMIKARFESAINVFANESSYEAGDSVRFIKSFFGEIPIAAVNVILSKLENNIRVYENELAKFCFNQIGSTDGGFMFNKIQVLVGQNSTCLKTGEELIIEAGMGSFSSTVKCTILINGENIPVIDGVAIYKSKIHLKAGKYSVPLKIDYISEDGIKKSVTKNVSYTVVE
ncbi:MAG: hypothetical protein IPP96_14890 [Chitinophagaceae bacterium]|nr:hypothetical protein [Chitinophagaceae bacterium]